MNQPVTFETTDDFLKGATKVLNMMRMLFPHIDENELKPVVMEYMLKHSTIKKP